MSQNKLFDRRLEQNLDLLIESEAPVDALTRADLKWSLEEKLALPVDTIFLQKGKNEALFKNSRIQGVHYYDESRPNQVRATALLWIFKNFNIHAAFLLLFKNNSK